MRLVDLVIRDLYEARIRRQIRRAERKIDPKTAQEKRKRQMERREEYLREKEINEETKSQAQ